MPDSITAQQLDVDTRSELRTLPGDLADAVARQLVAASLADDTEQAYAHAQAARQLAARVGVVRETCGVAAYKAGHWADALAELRAARRLTGRANSLPLMADCERALGRPDKALAIVQDRAAAGLDRATQIELRIVESGIRRDEGRPAAAVVALQVPELTDGRQRSWSARLYYAYADSLLEAGRPEEAREWFHRAAAADVNGETDADERLDLMDPVVIEDLAPDDDEDGEDGEEGSAEFDDEDELDEDESDDESEDDASGDDGDEPGEDESGDEGEESEPKTLDDVAAEGDEPEADGTDGAAETPRDAPAGADSDNEASGDPEADGGD